MPIRLRFNPTWYPEIDHWKATIFAGQNIVEFGSANYTPFELAPWSSTNYKDEVVLFTTISAIVNAFKTKFDRYLERHRRGAREPDSRARRTSRTGTMPARLNRACADYRTQYPNPAQTVLNTDRLEADNPLPPEMVWGQGPGFNNRLVSEIDKERRRSIS